VGTKDASVKPEGPSSYAHISTAPDKKSG
jgi:hypothetical protein